jgi:8-oxo-dGTP diphosphatase
MTTLQEKLSQPGNERLCPVAVFIDDGRILVGLRNYTPDKWKAVSVWTCPGGRCDDGEKDEKTVRREVREEIGITDFEIMKYMGEVPGGKEGDIVPLFLCRTSQSPKLMEPEKFSEWKWISVKELPENYINNDAKKVIEEFLLKEDASK